MLKSRLRIVGLIVISVLVLYILFHRTENNVIVYSSTVTTDVSYTLPTVSFERMAIAVVVCGNRTKETLVMIKSSLLLTKGHLHFHIFVDDASKSDLVSTLDKWKQIMKKFSYSILPVKFPPGEFQTEWRKLFKPCASQRLFLPGLLSEADSVLYVDTDTLFLGPVEQVWEHFGKMNASQLAALAPEHEDPHIGWYNRFAKHPFYKPLGVNTGVMLMNLTRMRFFGWEDYISPIYKQYKSNIPWGDQDIINIIFSFHPEKLYVYGCNYNFRADHCMYTSVCKQAESEGIVVLHGSRGIFHNNKHPTFRSVFKAFDDFDWSQNVTDWFQNSFKKYLRSVPESQCGVISYAFYRNFESYIEQSATNR